MMITDRVRDRFVVDDDRERVVSPIRGRRLQRQRRIVHIRFGRRHSYNRRVQRSPRQVKHNAYQSVVARNQNFYNVSKLYYFYCNIFKRYSFTIKMLLEKSLKKKTIRKKREGVSRNRVRMVEMRSEK